MQRSIWAVLGATVLVLGAAEYGQTHAAPGTPQAIGKSGVHAGQLSCQVEGGTGFGFDSSKELDCLFKRTDGVAEHYHGSIQKFGTGGSNRQITLQPFGVEDGVGPNVAASIGKVVRSAGK